MSKIVAISDLHLGQNGVDGLGQYSLLSTKVPQNLVRKFVDAVAAFAAGEPITLLVAGDFLDLSLAYAEDALEDLRELLTAFVGMVRIDEIIYTIGNHDHHLWSLHSEDKRLLGPLRSGLVPGSSPLAGAKAMYQVTSPSGERFDLLQPLVDRIFGSMKITIAYPTFTRQLDAKTQLYVTHGHLFGGLYTELSDLVGSKPLAGIPHDRAMATVNQPLIEFIYWLLGEIGEGLGADGLVERIYTDMQRGTLSRVRGIVARLVAQVLPNGVHWRALGRWERRLVVDAVMAELGKLLLTPPAKANASAARYADVMATRAGLAAWLEAVGWSKEQSTIALYGHTHVWDEYAVPGTAVQSWNLCTWLVEPDHQAPRTGFLAIDGAAARWIDVV